MNFTAEVSKLAVRLRRVIKGENFSNKHDLVIGELVMPFLQMMDYSNSEVVPRFPVTGMFVDLAIIRDGKPVIVIECKTNLRKDPPRYLRQLGHYFNYSEARYGILTDGRIYRFFTDCDRHCFMDLTPFFEFDFLDYTDAQVDQLKRFTKSDFD